jgi:photosystem II stability/assembly factor-like uncharacterized protein
MTRTALLFALALLSTPVLAVSATDTTAIDPSRLAGLKARSIGPAAMSGRVAAVTGVESDPDIFYAGAANGGVWKSVNGGLTWAPLFDDQKVASIGALAVFRANPDIVWAGTGEGNPRNSVSVGNGIYRSLDGGRTWSHLGLDATEHISRIVLHPTNPDVAWVAAMGKLWGENAERGIFKTTDGGKTWRKVLYADERSGAAALVQDPQNPNKLFAALWDHRRQPWTFRSGGPGSGLYVTVDGGETWKRLTEEDGLPKGDLGRIGLAISHSSPEIVYALVEAEKSALLRSDDGGKTWKTVNDDQRTAERPFYYSDIEVDPAWPNRLYNLTARLQVSNDSGKTFEVLGRTRDIHGDYHAIWIDPLHPEHILVGNDGGLGISRDRGATWDFVTDLPIGQFYHVAVDMDVPYHVYGGLQDNGSWRGPVEVWERGGILNHHWDRIGGGDGFDSRPDPEDSQRGWSMSQGGDLLRWNLRTGEAKAIKPAEVKPNDPAGRLRFNWNAGFATDPFAPGTIYLGSQFVHKSADRGETWTVISPDLTTNNPDWRKYDTGGITPDVTGAETFTSILAIAPSPVQRGVLWVGTDDGRLHVTRDGGATWESVEKNVKGVPANTWIPHVLASRYDAGTAFMVFDNHRRSDWAPYVYKTTDWGKTWTSLASKDLWGWAESIEQDPVDRDLLFLGTSFGLYVSNDGGKRWMHWTHGLPTTEVADLIVHPRDGDLVIATHGRALYVLDDITPLRSLTAAALQEPLHLYPSAPGRLHQNLMGGFRGGSGYFRGENRPYGVQLTYSLNLPGLPLQSEAEERGRKEQERTEARKAAETAQAGKPPAGGKQSTLKEDPATQPAAAAESDEKGKSKEPKVQIRITDASGKLVRTMDGPAKLGVNRAVWDLGRDPFKTPSTDSRGRPRDNDSGPKVPPGSYTVTVKYKGHETKGTVQVATDPYTKNTEADWQAHEAALTRLGALQDAAVTAIERIKAARADIDLVLKKLEPAGKDKAAKSGDDPNKALKQSARDLQKKLSDLEKRLYVPPTVKGIIDDQTVMTGAQNIRESLESSWDRPNANQLASLDAAEAQSKAILADFNKVFSTDVAAFRKQVADAKIDLLAPQDPITLGG